MQPYEVFAIRYGRFVERRGNLLTGGDPDRALRMDYYFWLARNDTRALLIDTGFSASAAAERGRTMVRNPAEALRDIQGSGEVDALLLTHLHYDHTGNLDLAPRAPIYVGRRELEFWEGEADAAERQLVESPDLARLEAAREEGRVTLVGDREEIAPGIVAQRVGGHTPGQLVVEIAVAGGPLVLASDALHFYEELDGGATFVPTIDPPESRRAIERLRQLAADGATVIPGHDPKVRERFGAVGAGSSTIRCTAQAPPVTGSGRKD